MVRKSYVNKEICLYRYYFLFGTVEVINKNFKKYELESRKIKRFLFWRLIWSSYSEGQLKNKYVSDIKFKKEFYVIL